MTNLTHTLTLFIFLFLYITAGPAYVVLADDENIPQVASIKEGVALPAPTQLPLDNLAKNLPEAFDALEQQFQNAEFRSMLTSQLNNPNAVQLFHSLIHDQRAISSISSLLNEPSVQASLKQQFEVSFRQTATGTQQNPNHTPTPHAATSHISSDNEHRTRSKGREEVSQVSMSDLYSLDSSHGRRNIIQNTALTGWLVVLLVTAFVFI